MSNESTDQHANRCPYGCDFYEAAPTIHDRLLGLETMPVLEACELMAAIIAYGETYTGETVPFSDPDDFGRFVAQHNWSNPRAMFELAGHVDWAADVAWPEVCRRRREDRALVNA